MHRSVCRKLFAMPSISQPGWPHSVSVIRDSSPAHRHPNEPWHWLQAFLQTEHTGPSNSISTLRLSSPDYKAGCGCRPTGTRLIFHALRYWLQTIRPLRLFLLMWKMWGCFIYEKEWRGPIKQVADAAIKDIWRLWWRFESCIRELFKKKNGRDPDKQSDGALGAAIAGAGTVFVWLCWKGSWSGPLQVAFLVQLSGPQSPGRNPQLSIFPLSGI